MNAPVRALLYGFGVWVALMVISVILLPLEGGNDALHESLKQGALVALVIVLSVRFLAKQPVASWLAGLGIGMLWAAVTIGLDLALFATGAFNLPLIDYFLDVATSYLAMPIITTLLMGLLQRRAASPQAAAPAAGAALAQEPVAAE